MTNDQADFRCRPQLRWWQCDRKTLLLAMFITAAAFGWLSVMVALTQGQRQAVAEIEKLGGQVYYDFQWDEDGQWAGRMEPSWLRKLFGNVRAVLGNATEITDDSLMHFSRLTMLETLDLTNTHITGSGFQHIQGLDSLKSIYLGNTNTNDAGLEHLKRLSSLKHIILSDTPITDVGLEHLARLVQLQSLRIQGTNTSTAGVNKLRKALPNCQIVR